MGTVTILGQHISVVRPKAPHKSIVYKDERPRVKSPVRSKRGTCYKVALICVEVLGGIIYGVPKGCHIDVLNTFELSPDQVIRTGWQLDDGQFMWR